jgi:hypothetical protein
LANASTGELEKLAALPRDSGGQPRTAPPPAPVAALAAPSAPAPAARRRAQFWRQPALAPAAVRLAPGVTLVLDAAPPLSADDHEAVRAAAAGLLDRLSSLLEEH